VQLPGDEKAKAFKRALRSLVNVNHIASILELQARIYEAEEEEPSLNTVRGYLQRHPNVVWLDDDHSWFWVRQAEGRNRIIRWISRMLAVAGPLPPETLREGILRYHRTRNTILPRSVFAGLCRAAGFQLEDGVVSPSGHIEGSEVLQDNQETMVSVLKSHRNIIW
jgi:hypothetical protein